MRPVPSILLNSLLNSTNILINSGNKGSIVVASVGEHSQFGPAQFTSTSDNNSILFIPWIIETVPLATDWMATIRRIVTPICRARMVGHRSQSVNGWMTSCKQENTQSHTQEATSRSGQHMICTTAMRTCGSVLRASRYDISNRSRVCKICSYPKL